MTGRADVGFVPRGWRLFAFGEIPELLIDSQAQFSLLVRRGSGIILTKST